MFNGREALPVFKVDLTTLLGLCKAISKVVILRKADDRLKKV